MPSEVNSPTIRAAIYARYSSDNQRDASIDDQVRICRAEIERNGWDLVQVYADPAISGASTFRPGYQKLLLDASTGAIDVVVAESLDRLSRDLADVATLYKHLSYLGVRLWTVAEQQVNELHVGLKGTMNALYLKDLAQKTHRGLEGRVRSGMSGGGICYGYDLVPGQTGVRKINEAEAMVVVRIFEEYAAARSPRAIAQQGRHTRPSRWTLARHHHPRPTSPGALESSTTSSTSAAWCGTGSIS
jgi:site-specific DNA recombinase